jgi:hypothetical protein
VLEVTGRTRSFQPVIFRLKLKEHTTDPSRDSSRLTGDEKSTGESVF